MIKRMCPCVVVSLVSVLLLAGVAGAQQYPMLDKVAAKVVAKYQQANCEQLWKDSSVSTFS